MHRIFALLALLGTAFAQTSGAESGSELFGATRVYTLVNLHPDEQRSRLYAANFQQAGLIPMCSEVEIVQLTRKRMTFRVPKRNKVYHYNYHKAAAEPFDAHLRRFFGPQCDSEAVQSLGEVDRAGIRRGRVSLGMSKQGVIFALGYPPRHVTPDLDQMEWMYWKSRFNRMLVVFDENGIVSELRD